MGGRRRRRGKGGRKSNATKTAKDNKKQVKEPEPVPSTSKESNEELIDLAVAGPSRPPDMCPKCAGYDDFPVCYKEMCGEELCEGAPIPEEYENTLSPYLIAICSRRVRRQLVLSGKMSEMVTYMQRRLAQSGWRVKMMRKCREIIREKGDAVKFEELYEGIKDHGSVDKVPLKVKMDLFVSLFRGPGCEVVQKEFDQINEVLTRRSEAQEDEGACPEEFMLNLPVVRVEVQGPEEEEDYVDLNEYDYLNEYDDMDDDEDVNEDEEINEDEQVAGAEVITVPGGLFGAEGGVDEHIGVSNLPSESLGEVKIYDVEMDEVSIDDLPKDSPVEVIVDQKAMAIAILARESMAEAIRMQAEKMFARQAEAARAEAEKAEVERAEAARAESEKAEVERAEAARDETAVVEEKMNQAKIE